MTDREAILELMQHYTRALHAKNGTALAETYTRDAAAYDLAPPLVTGSDTLTDAKSYDEWFATWDGPIISTPHEPTLTIDGSLAACWALVNLQGKKKDGQQVDMWFRSTMVLGKVNGEWKVAHVHNSVPFAMDGSFRALVDLKP